MEMIYLEAHSVFLFPPASMHGSLLHSPGNFDGFSHLHRLDDNMQVQMWDIAWCSEQVRPGRRSEQVWPSSTLNYTGI